MAVLITGGAGYIGSHMVLEMLERGEKTVVLDNLSTGFRSSVAQDAKLVVGDIGNSELVEKILKDHEIDSIFHFAGSVVVPESIADPASYYSNNTLNTRTMIDVAIACGVEHFIFSSTAAVYGVTGYEPVTEDHPLLPTSPYGRSKLMSEWMLQDAKSANDFRYATLRYFNVAGCDPLGRTGQSTKGATHLIKVTCETALRKRPYMEIFGDDYDTPDGTCMRDFIHVSDLVQIHALALDYLRKGGESITANCGYGHGYSVREIIDCVERVSGNKIDARVVSRRPGDLVAVFADSLKAQNEFCWNPRYDDLETIVSTALSWEQSLKERVADETGK